MGGDVELAVVARCLRVIIVGGDAAVGMTGLGV